MAEREAVNRQLREAVHNELDQISKLFSSICDANVRAAGELKYNQLLKLVEDRSKRVRSDSLKKIMVAAQVVKDTLKKLIEPQKSSQIVATPASKIETADIVAEEIYNMASSYDSERIALKYKRKKVEVSKESFNVTSVPTKRSTSPLFHRRHEVFPPPKSVAATYGEHRRQMQMMKPEAIVTPTRSSLPENRPLSVDPRVEHYRKIAKYVPPFVSERRPVLSVPSCQNNEIARAENSKNNLVENARSISGTNEEMKNISEDTPQCIETALEKNCNANQKMIETAIGIQETTGKSLESEVKTTIDPQEVTGVNKLNESDVPDASSKSHTASEKPKNLSKSGKLTRELKDLLSDYTEYMDNCNRKDKINLANNQQKNDQDVLLQFGIKKKVSVVLKDSCTNGNVPSPQIQREPSQPPKQSSFEITLRRRNSVCVDSQTELQDLQKSKKTRKKVSKDEDGAIRLPKAVKSTSRGQGKNKKVTLHSNGTLNSDTASQKLNQSSTLPEPTKTATKRKLRRKSVTDVAKKRLPLDVPGEESNSLQRIETTSVVDYNNKEEIHCHSEYMTKCRLCDFTDVQQTNIVSHYVYQHPASEVIVSRITPEQARIVKQSPCAVDGKQVLSRHGYQTISFRCHFCEMRKTLVESDWVHHLVNHTGEYRFRCRACPAMARTSDESVTHEEICGDPEMIVCNDITFEENHMYGYMCELCNYIQIRRFNMDRHLRREHPFEAATCIQFSLVNYENDQEYGTFGSYNTSVKLEPIENHACYSIVNSMPFVKDEQIDEGEESVFDETRLEPIIPKQEEFLGFAEEEEPSLPAILEQNKQALEQNWPFTDCENSNDSNCTLPMNFFDEETMPNLGTESDMLNTPICEQGIILKDVKKENMMNDISHAIPPIGVHPKDPNIPTNGATVSHICPRMLPGDVLSNISNMEQIVAHNPDNADVSCSVPSAHTKLVYPINVVVKPWIEDQSATLSNHYSKEITYKCLGSFYKCMGDDCSFHSDEIQNMRQHLFNHCLNDSRNHVARGKTWLECCYCQHTAFDGDSLLSHLNVVHKNCAFQCNRCFYRSREASSVVIHQSTYHVDDEVCNMILECTKQYKKFSLVDQDAIIQKMNSTVEQLKCAACNSKKYFDLLEYKTHLTAHKEPIGCHICNEMIPTSSMLKHLKSHHIFLYQCVHCVYGTDQKYVIKNHVSREHAEKICCFHIREVKRTNGANMPNALVPTPLRPFVRVELTIPNDRIRTYC